MSKPAAEPYEAARLRPADLSDTARLVVLYNLARPEAAPETAASMADWLEHGGALLLETPDARALCALRWRETDEGWRVDRIATLPEARSQGYGRWLMTKVEALAIRANIPTLNLQLEDARPELSQYYERMGYRVVGGDGGAVTLNKRVGGTWQTKR